MFADVLRAYELSSEEGGIKLSQDDMLSFLQERAQAEYLSWEERILAKRGCAWTEAEMTELARWLDSNKDVILAGLEAGPTKQEDVDRYNLRGRLIEAMVFPLLRPEFQGLPYLSRAVTQAFCRVAKPEADGLKALVNGPLGTGRRKVDLSTIEATVNDVLPKFVVKVYASVAVERPFTWQLLGHVLIDRTHDTPVSAFKNLPDLRSLPGPDEVAEYVKGKWRNLTERLTLLAHEEETGNLREDIAGAYQGLNEVHRIAEEILHSSGRVGHNLDEDFFAIQEIHHGWIDEVSQGAFA